MVGVAPNTQEAAGHSSTCKDGVQEFESVPHYIVSLRAAWATWDSNSKNKNKWGHGGKSF